MVEGTRCARIQASVAPLRSNGVTRVSTLRMEAGASAESLFRDKQRMMASAIQEEARPGLFVFAAHQRFGHVARLWLEATPSPRAGLIGRHDEVDLALPLDDTLSLRHLMFVVRRRADGVRYAAIDLESHSGLQLESGQSARLVESTGPLILSASDFVFFCFPTGRPAPWDRDSRDPWRTLAPRRSSRLVPSHLPPNDTIAGRVELASPTGVVAVAVGGAALLRGLLVGRAERCDVVTPVETVSRVHVVLLRLEDELFVVDAGSTNGTWRGDRELKAAPLRDSDVLRLGEEVSLCWRAAH